MSFKGGVMSICTAPVYKLKELNSIFIELTAKNCNARCKSCYIDFPISKNVKDFLPIETVKKCLSQTKNENLHCIYLTGGEPMTHPDFNSILRLCLKRCNVCICTNGSFLNEKKIRFLKKVEDEGEKYPEGENQIFFRLSLTHYNEIESDNAKYRGNFRQTIHALTLLSRYNFSSVLNIQNFYNLDKNELEENLRMIFDEHNITNTNVHISKSYPSNEYENIQCSNMTDCMTSRTLTSKGVFTCPFLANDYRGRSGSDFTNYSKTTSAETDFCTICSQNDDCIFQIG